MLLMVQEPHIAGGLVICPDASCRCSVTWSVNADGTPSTEEQRDYIARKVWEALGASVS
ncbi:MAG: hypothetical protein WCS84_15395 [Nocardioides sp.]